MDIYYNRVALLVLGLGWKVRNSSGCLPNTFPKALINYEILEAGNSVDLVLDILERAALRLTEDAPLHLHEPKGHFDMNTTLARVEI
jgi:hypothetical protein